MRRLLLVLLLMAVVPLSAVSYITFEQITVAAASIGLTTTKILPDGVGSGRQATLASCRLETAEIRFTTDGTVPTTTVGTLLEIGETVVITGFDSLTKFRAIRTGATSGQLDCTESAP